jgi:hypothetical protein
MPITIADARMFQFTVEVAFPNCAATVTALKELCPFVMFNKKCYFVEHSFATTYFVSKIARFFASLRR